MPYHSSLRRKESNLDQETERGGSENTGHSLNCGKGMMRWRKHLGLASLNNSEVRVWFLVD